jgi:glycerol-3-phosphate acyltransferase PlsY
VDSTYSLYSMCACVCVVVVVLVYSCMSVMFFIYNFFELVKFVSYSVCVFFVVVIRHRKEIKKGGEKVSVTLVSTLSVFHHATYLQWPVGNWRDP